jgi:tetratricopeptide (TPR) repeat protein
MFLHAMGRPLLKPIAQESLGVLTQQGGFVELIPRGTELPFPSNGDLGQFRGLVVPRDLMGDVQIVVAAEGPGKVLGIERLELPELRSAGEPIDLRFRLDANKMLVVEASLANHPDARCQVTLENPLCPAGFRSERHQRILELEERVVRGVVPGGNGAHLADATEELASLHLEERKYEKAIECARTAMELEGRPDGWMLNLSAIAYEKLGAMDRAEKHYREACKAEPGVASLRYNLSLFLERRGQIEEALEQAWEASRLAPTEGAYQGQQGSLLQRLGERAKATKAFKRAADLLDAVPAPSPFQRNWRTIVAEALGDSATAARFKKEEPSGRATPAYDEDKLPAESAALARRA